MCFLYSLCKAAIKGGTANIKPTVLLGLDECYGLLIIYRGLYKLRYDYIYP